jgi:hypothetical protein
VGFRRSPARLAAAREWQRFVENNAKAIAAAGLPPAVTARLQAWDDFLMRGTVAGDPNQFSMSKLEPRQYQSLVELVHSYFDAGYEFFAPMALRPSDRDALLARFGGR